MKLLNISVVLLCTPVVTCKEVISLHGSGTTNPSKCLWGIMSNLKDRALAPLHITYRAVGSGTGIDEFIGNVDNEYKPYSNFGAGDIPVKEEKYSKVMTDDGESTMLHLPFVISAVSFFHSIPNVPEGKGGLNLTSCLLAQIFSGEIDVWDHDDILDKNPNLKSMLPSSSYTINIAHRVEGSSSTKSITQYLNSKCPKHWPNTQVNSIGKNINWATRAFECDSSGKMTSCIRNNAGTIGYIDSGHGWEEKLTEIELQNEAGTFLSSSYSYENNGMSAAAISATKAIDSFDESFDGVNLLNQPGDTTWPILVMSYIYVRLNISEYMPDKEEQALLKIFLQAIYTPQYIDDCKSLGFTPVPDEVKQKAEDAMQWIQFDTDVPEFSFEFETEVYEGQNPLKISSKRRTYGEYERSKLDFESRLLKDEVSVLMKQVTELQDRLAVSNQGIANLTNEISAKADQRSQTTAALTLAAISIAFWGLAILYFLSKRVMY